MMFRMLPGQLDAQGLCTIQICGELARRHNQLTSLVFEHVEAPAELMRPVAISQTTPPTRLHGLLPECAWETELAQVSIVGLSPCCTHSK